jgi:ribosome-interacting GTPase 1
MLRELVADRFPLLAVSAEAGTNIDALRGEMFALLNVIRVYTKAPGHRADLSAPFVLKRGATVQEAAAVVHKDFSERLKYARIWGAGAFDGQMVQREHILEDGDILELRM